MGNRRLEDWAVAHDVVEEDGPVTWLYPAPSFSDKK
jgi:hypothetical protein